MSRDYKLIFVGPMGAGKTTAIAAISTKPPVVTEARNTDRRNHAKATTTVALDYGEVAIEGGRVLRLYGVPGQSRFSFMWPMVGRGALGAVLLADATGRDGVASLDPFLAAFEPLLRDQRAVVGICRGEMPGAVSTDAFVDHVAALGLTTPVFSVDVRRRADVHLLLDVLFVQLERRTKGIRSEPAQ
jgi:signal recognition particle receptor subunit beta